MNNNIPVDYAVIFIVDPPAGLDFGIDCMNYETGPDFRGLSLVPPGLHFVYHSTGMGSRQGFFIVTQRDEIHIKRWDTVNEEISHSLNLPEGSLHNLNMNIRAGKLDKYLGPYPVDQHHLWVNITGLISGEVLQRADIGPGTLVYPGDSEDISILHSESPISTEVKPYFPNIARIARFSDITSIENKLKYEINDSNKNHLSGHYLTSIHIDKSQILERIISNQHNNKWEDLLGELQLSFLLFLVLFSYPALEFYKKLFNIICNADSFLLANPTFTATFLRIVYEQLNFSPDDFFQTELSRDNFLRPALTALFYNLNSPKLSEHLAEHKRRLLTFIRKKFSILDTTEEYRQFGGVSGYWAPGEEELFNLVEEDRPVIVDVVLEHHSGDSVFVQSSMNSVPPVAPEEDTQRLLARDRELDRMIHEVNASLSLSHHTGDTHTRASTAMETDSESTYSPVSVAHLAVRGTVPDHPIPAPVAVDSVPLSAVEMELSMFSWRYPHLFSCMRPELHEDFAMAARRLLDEHEDGVGAQSRGYCLEGEQRMALLEATMFLSEEVPRRANAAM